jgi:protein-S-isoprenylcysteine O-methyltransferase Ste14
MNITIRKIIRILIYLAYYLIILYLLVPGVFIDLILLTIIALDVIVFSVDALLRPLRERGEVDTPTKIMGLLFLFHPFVMALFFYDNVFITSVYIVVLNSNLVAYIGIGLFILAAAILFSSRVQLGRFGDGRVDIKDQHELLTDGIYKHIRHPLYSGGLLGKIATGLAFRSYLATFLMLIVYFLVFRSRIEIEERTLTAEFGGAYTSYVERTKRLLPYIY